MRNDTIDDFKGSKNSDIACTRYFLFFSMSFLASHRLAIYRSTIGAIALLYRHLRVPFHFGMNGVWSAFPRMQSIVKYCSHSTPGNTRERYQTQMYSLRLTGQTSAAHSPGPISGRIHEACARPRLKHAMMYMDVSSLEVEISQVGSRARRFNLTLAKSGQDHDLPITNVRSTKSTFLHLCVPGKKTTHDRAFALC